MTRYEVIARIRSRAEDIRALGADALFLFGSAAQDRLRADSDIDVFIDRDPETEFTFVQLTNLQMLLEGEIGRVIDLTTRGGLHPRLRDRIEASAIRVL